MLRKTIVASAILSVIVVGVIFAAVSGRILPGPRPVDAVQTTLIYVEWPVLLFWTVLFVLWTAGTLRDLRRQIRRLEQIHGVNRDA